MTDYKKYINALRKCAKEHEDDRTSFGHIIVSDLCRDTANLMESLEQEPCEDCISREAVLDYFEQIKKEYPRIYTAIEVSIRLLPSVTPKPKAGHWIYIRNSEVNGLKIVKCSECGKRTYGSGKYCPNCGAKMVESEEACR